MIAALVRADIGQAIERLNRRNIFECNFIRAKNTEAARKQIEDGGSYSHIIIDMAYFAGDIDTGLDLVGRLTKTLTGTVVAVVDNSVVSLSVLDDTLKAGVKPDNIINISGNPARLNKCLLEILLRDRVVLESDIPALEVENTPAPPPPDIRDAAPATPLKTHNESVTIAVAGAGPGVGCTTQAMQLLLYLRSHGASAALIEVTDRHSLSAYSSVLDDTDYVVADETHLIICGADIYLGGRCFTKARRSHRYLICDYGDYCDIPDITAFLDKKIRVIVGGAKPWDMEHFADIFEADDGANRYIFSFVAAGDQTAVRRGMEDSADKTFFANYAPDYFNFCGDDALYASVLGNDTLIQGVPGIPPQKKKKGFFFWGK